MRDELSNTLSSHVYCCALSIVDHTLERGSVVGLPCAMGYYRPTELYSVNGGVCCRLAELRTGKSPTTPSTSIFAIKNAQRPLDIQ